MPDANGRFKGISTHGVNNAWLDAKQMQKDRDAQLENVLEGFKRLFDAPAHESLQHPHKH